MNDLPAYIVAALKKGLKLHYAGHSGDGLVRATIQMAIKGSKDAKWPDEKVVKASAWFKRHIFDREKMKNPSQWDKPPSYSPAFVAWLLWGDSGDGRGAEWIHKRADEIRAKSDENKKSGGASTKAPPEDRIKGGRNTGRAGTSGRGISLSPATNKGLKAKVSAHNDEHGDDPRKRVTLSMLQKVYLRAAGAFSTSHRPGMTRGQWSFGRVNAFLYLLRNLKPFRKGYTTDNDLLPSEHPLSPKKEQLVGGALSNQRKAKENKMDKIKEYGRILSGMRYEMGKLAREAHCTEAERVELNQMLKDVDEGCCYGSGMKCRCDLHSIMMMVSKMLSRVKDADKSRIHAELEEMLGRYEGMAFGPMYDGYHDVEEVASEPNFEGIEDPTAEQRSNLPPEAFEPSAFFANKEGDYDVDGEFRSSLSKLPHHINSVVDSSDNDSVDVPRLRNALARFNQVDWSKFPPRTEMQTRAHLEKHADALLYAAKENGCKNCKQEDIDALKVELSLFRSGEFEELGRLYAANTKKD